MRRKKRVDYLQCCLIGRSAERQLQLSLWTIDEFAAVGPGISNGLDLIPTYRVQQAGLDNEGAKALAHASAWRKARHQLEY